jgi:hypothetical protein
MVRLIPALVTVLLLTSPAFPRGQTFVVHGAAGPTINDPGYSLAVGVGISLTSRLTFGFTAERTHLPSRIETYHDGFSAAIRGGTLTLASGEMRFAILGRNRVSPYVLTGIAAGLARPDVTPIFPSRVTHDVLGSFFGGGLLVPVGEKAAVFAEARMMLAIGSNDLFAVVPIRGGIAWHF